MPGWTVRSMVCRQVHTENWLITICTSVHYSCYKICIISSNNYCFAIFWLNSVQSLSHHMITFYVYTASKQFHHRCFFIRICEACRTLVFMRYWDPTVTDRSVHVQKLGDCGGHKMHFVRCSSHASHWLQSNPQPLDRRPGQPLGHHAH